MLPRTVSRGAPAPPAASALTRGAPAPPAAAPRKRPRLSTALSGASAHPVAEEAPSELDDGDDAIASRPSLASHEQRSSSSSSSSKGKHDKKRPPSSTKGAAKETAPTASKKAKKAAANASGMTPTKSGAAAGPKLSKDAPPVWSASKDVGASGEYDGVVIETQVGCDD